MLGEYKSAYALLVPYWIEKVLVRNNLPLSTIFNYPKLRDVLSFDDIVSIVRTNTNTTYPKNSQVNTIFDYFYPNYLYNNWSKTSTDVFSNELNSLRRDYFYKDECEETLLPRLSTNALSPNDRAIYNTGSKPYSIKVDSNNDMIYVVLLPGFTELINEPSVTPKFLFIRELLKAFTEKFDELSVFKNRLFLNYLKVLNAARREALPTQA